MAKARLSRIKLVLLLLLVSSVSCWLFLHFDSVHQRRRAERLFADLRAFPYESADFTQVRDFSVHHGGSAAVSFQADFANPSQSTFTGTGLADPITAPTYVPLCGGEGQGWCVPQEATGTKLSPLADRLMYRLAYWDDGPLAHIGPNAGPIPAQHWSVNHVATASGGQAGVRWYEFRAPVRTATISDVTLYQSGTFAPDSNYRWMASIAQDKMGDIALGYSIASTTMWDSTNATGRVPTDPLGQMEAETSLIAGTGSEDLEGGWGDYSSMAIDSDGCTFWYAQMYYTVPASNNWQTRLTSVKFSGCH
jgi:hypothetical protein